MSLSKLMFCLPAVTIGTGSGPCGYRQHMAPIQVFKRGLKRRFPVGLFWERKRRLQAESGPSASRIPGVANC
jgi:hypothetical protein